MYDSITLGFALPAGVTYKSWIETAPVWVGYEGQINNGYCENRFGEFPAGKLTVHYNPDTDRGQIRGSVHSFCHGHNSGPFSFADALDTCEKIAAALLIPPSALRVHSLETGVTVPTGEAPKAFLALVARAHYGPKQKPFYAKEPPANSQDTLEFYAKFGQYRVKIYDKGTYNRLKNKPLPPGTTGNGFRFEIQYSKSEKLAAVLGWHGTVTLANLMQPAVFNQLADALFKGWHLLHLPPTMDSTTLSIDERALLIAGSEPGFWESSKSSTPPATYKRKRSLFNKLQKAQAQSSGPTPFTDNLKEQIRTALP